MKKSTRRRPELETLEAVLLLSTVMAESHQAVSKVAVVAPTGPIQLTGSFPLKAEKFSGLKGIVPASTGFVGSGNLVKFGRTAVVLEGTGGPEGFIIGLGNRQGFISLAAEISLPANGSSTTAQYQAIDGGGDAINHASHTGTVTITEVPLKGGKPSYTLKLS